LSNEVEEIALVFNCSDKGEKSTFFNNLNRQSVSKIQIYKLGFTRSESIQWARSYLLVRISVTWQFLMQKAAYRRNCVNRFGELASLDTSSTTDWPALTPSTTSGTTSNNSDVTVMAPLTEDRLAKILDAKLKSMETSILAAITKEVDHLKKVNIELKITIEKQQTSITKLESSFEQLDLDKRRKNFIVKNIPETSTDLKGTVMAISKALSVNLEVADIKSVFRLGKTIRDDGKARPILVKSKKDIAYNMITRSRKLQETATYKGVYIDRDLPPLIATALAALRKRAYEYKRDHPGSTAYVKSNKLYFDDSVVDSVNIK
jgi:hypothetical protein